MAIKDKRARYKKGKRVDMRQGGRVQLAKGSSAATKRKKKAAQAKKAAAIQQPTIMPSIGGRRPVAAVAEEQSQVIRPAGKGQAGRPIAAQVSQKPFDPNLGRPKPQSGILQNQLSPLSQQGITSPATPEERQRFEERQLRMQAAATGPRGGPLVPPTPEEIARRKAIQAQPIPEGFVRNLATGELEPMRPPVPGEFDTLQGQPISPQQQLLNEAQEARGRPKEQQPIRPGDQPVRKFPAATPEQLAEERRTAGLPLFQAMQAQQAAPAGAPKTQEQLLASMQGMAGMAGATAKQAAPAATAAAAGAAVAGGPAGLAARTVIPVPADDYLWNPDWDSYITEGTMTTYGIPHEDPDADNYFAQDEWKKLITIAQGTPPAGWMYGKGEGDSYRIEYESPPDFEIPTSVTWLTGGEGFPTGQKVGGPFPDPSKIAYGQPTATEIAKARYQVEAAAKGEVPPGAEIPTPAQLKTDDPRFTGKGNFDFSVDWQEGGNIGKYSKTDGGQTGEELFQALYAAGSDGEPADSIVVAGKTYTWDDFNNLINLDKGLHGTQKPTGIYEADVTKLADDIKFATAGTTGTTPVEDVSVVPSQVYTQEFMDANKGTIAKNDLGYTSKDILEMTVGIQPMPAGQNYTPGDALKLLQQEQTLIGTPNPLFAAQKQVAEDAQKAGIERVGEYYDEEGNLVEGKTPTVKYATQTDAEGKTILTQEAAVEQYRKDEQGNIIRDAEGKPISITSLTEKAVAAGVPETQAIIEAKATFVAGALTTGAKAEALPSGYSFTPPADGVYPQNMPPEGMRFAYGPGGERIEVSLDTVARGIGGQVSETPKAERSERDKILGAVDDETAAFIDGSGLTFEHATRSVVTGKERTRGGIEMIGETTGLPPDIAAEIIDDPGGVAEKLDVDDVAVIAAIAPLPVEALVSVQMEGLLAGMEEGTIPTWARPAVAQIQDMMAERGLDVSTVARDSLFNAIIQSALPIAQSNAQALQARAQQNLSNQQQANLAIASQDMQRRLTNVANQQTASSQSAQMANNIAIQQGTFGQQAGVRTAELQQQQRTQNLANLQEAARITKQQEQEAQMASLSNEQQISVLDLQIESERLKDEMSADQQGRLLKYQTAADFMSKNEAFVQEMNKANLSKDVQVELANLQSKNLYESELMSNDEKIELANLQTKVQIGITNANLANAMGIAQLSADQAAAMQNAQVQAGMDMANFSTEQQMELANSKFLQTITVQDFSQRQQAAMQNATALASLDMAAVDQRTKLAITNANNFLQMDMVNLNNEQQSYVLDAQMQQQALLSDQAAFNASEQFNAASQNQLDQYMSGLAQQIEITNVQRNDAMNQFNATQKNAAAARQAGNEQQARLLTAQLTTDVNKFNDAQDYNREVFNAQQSNAIEQFNVSWRRDANKMDTAAINAVNQQNAQNAFGLSTQAMGFMWQELRDQMDYSFKTYDNDQQRKASLIVAALGNEQAADEDGWSETWTGFGKLISEYVND